MMPATRILVIGADANTRLLAQRLGPNSPVAGGLQTITHWWPSGAGQDALAAREQASVAGAAFGQASEAIPDVEAVVVAGAPEDRVRAAARALAAGKTVLCPLPLAGGMDDLQTLQAGLQAGGCLIAPGLIAASDGGRLTLEAVRASRLGAVHAIFGALRTRQGNSEDMLATPLVDLYDVVLRIADADPVLLFAAAVRMDPESAGNDGALVTIRFASGAIATLDVSSSLPTSVAVEREVELEVAGQLAALRLEPLVGSVHLDGQITGAVRRPFQAPAMVSLLGHLEAPTDSLLCEDKQLTHLRRLQKVVAATHQSLQERHAIALQ